eukprot:jgi/Picre1/29833/NNA_005215.t1
MSGFYVVNHFYGLSPKALLDDVRETTDSFCSLEWNKVVERHEGELAVETYCFRGEYVEALLLNGLRLSDAKVRLGYESPGWPLGAALVEGANAIPAMTHHAQLKRVKTSLLFSGLLISDVKVADKLRKGRFAPDGPAIAGKRTGAITALWAGKKPAKAQPDQKANG